MLSLGALHLDSENVRILGECWIEHDRKPAMLNVVPLIDVLLRLLLMKGELGLEVIDAEELRLEGLRENYNQFAIVSLILCD